MSEPCTHERGDHDYPAAIGSFVAQTRALTAMTAERDALKAEVETLAQRNLRQALTIKQHQTQWDRWRDDCAERDATLAKVAAIVAPPDAALVVDRIRAALEPTDPKGTKP